MEQKPEITKDEKKLDANSRLEHKLNQVISLPGIADILDGLIRWFNSSSEQDVYGEFVVSWTETGFVEWNDSP